MRSIGGVAAVDDAKPHGARIAETAYTAGQIETKVAQLALETPGNEHMHAFTQNMVRDHPAAGGAG